MSNNPLNALFDIAVIREKVPAFSSEKLSEMIVCVRYFNFDPQISVMCMEELAKRRANGDVFDFETYIEASQKELPALDASNPDLRMLFSQLAKSHEQKSH